MSLCGGAAGSTLADAGFGMPPGRTRIIRPGWFGAVFGHRSGQTKGCRDLSQAFLPAFLTCIWNHIMGMSQSPNALSGRIHKISCAR